MTEGSPLREGPLQSVDFLYFFENFAPELSVNEQIKFRTISIELSRLARSLGEEEVAFEFEQTLRHWIEITRSLTSIESVVSKNVSRGDRWDKQCHDFQKLKSAKAITTITKVHLSEPDEEKYDTFTSRNALYARLLDVKSALDDILRIYKQKRTKFQVVKNTVGGVEGQVNTLSSFLSRIYKSLLEYLLRFLALSTCSPPNLSRGEALFLYTPELNANYKSSVKTPEQIKKEKAQATILKLRETIPSSRETSRGYIPGRGYLMVHKNTGNYRYSPRNESNTGGVPTTEELNTFFKQRDQRREENNQRYAPRNTLSRTITAAPPAKDPVSGLASIAEENETNSNQDGGKRKTRKARKGKKATRRR